jgi:RNA polymerase sigma-70 factor (ECF subfamily)
MPSRPRPSESLINDAELARRIASDDETAFEALMRCHNGGLFRVARAILKNEADAEDVLQETYLAAYRHIGEFRADAKLSTWLTRILINQALAKLRSRDRARIVVPFSDLDAKERIRREREDIAELGSSPEQSATRADFRRLIEQKIDELPVAFRTVFVLREVEDLSVEETATCLSIPEATVRSRMYRARGMLRESLARELDIVTSDVFQFGGERCDRVVAGVLARLQAFLAGASRHPSVNGDANPEK